MFCKTKATITAGIYIFFLALAYHDELFMEHIICKLSFFSTSFQLLLQPPHVRNSHLCFHTNKTIGKQFMTRSINRREWLIDKLQRIQISGNCFEKKTHEACGGKGSSNDFQRVRFNRRSIVFSAHT